MLDCTNYSYVNQLIVHNEMLITLRMRKKKKETLKFQYKLWNLWYRS